jgi:hypothetical protein
MLRPRTDASPRRRAYHTGRADDKVRDSIGYSDQETFAAFGGEPIGKFAGFAAFRFIAPPLHTMPPWDALILSNL